MSNDKTPEIVCDMGAIAADERENHMATAESIFSAVIDSRELEAGYAFRLPLETNRLRQTTDWIANERLCCPFFTFKLTVNEEFWLELTGPAEFKDELKTMIGTLCETGAIVPDKSEYIAAHNG